MSEREPFIDWSAYKKQGCDHCNRNSVKEINGNELCGKHLRLYKNINFVDGLPAGF